FFELLFFITMVIFHEADVEYIILETGLGGRYDATNLIVNPAVCVITKIGMDHMEYLGDTVDQIAFEKAGIIKESCPVVVYSGSDIVKNVIEKRASYLHAPLHDVRPQDISLDKFRDKSIDFCFNSRYYGYVTLTVSGSALYQMQNAALAVEAMGMIDREKRIPLQKIIQAVSHMKWEGRMEEILPNVYLDGAHNEDGIDAFLESVQAGGTKQNLLLFSVVKDKNYTSMIQKLAENNLFETIAITQIPGDRGLSLQQMETIFKKYTNQQIVQYKDPTEAFHRCVETKAKEGKMYVVGSLYLVGLIKGEHND
ncbi:MAG: bifunctional folylpolyglutamate synthase/dihydrofolate synthase, partial [Clostridiales bacterium]|nr:bifunctional folylpolyglutamate synthase/dihydrofolate synthase [Clostridiales bacterium]